MSSFDRTAPAPTIEFAHRQKPQARGFTPLDQHVEDLALGVDGVPQIDHPAIDFQIDFVRPCHVGGGLAVTDL